MSYDPTYDARTDAAIPLTRAVLCLDCETIRHVERSSGRCPCGGGSDIPLEYLMGQRPAMADANDSELSTQ